jgi:hypothetical protein
MQKALADLFVVVYFSRFLTVVDSAPISRLPQSFQGGNVCLQARI